MQCRNIERNRKVGLILRVMANCEGAAHPNSNLSEAVTQLGRSLVHVPCQGVVICIQASVVDYGLFVIDLVDLLTVASHS